jgi:hypothetical protein
MNGADLSPRGLAAMIAEFIRRLELRALTVVGNDTGPAIPAPLIAILVCEFIRVSIKPPASVRDPRQLRRRRQLNGEHREPEIRGVQRLFECASQPVPRSGVFCRVTRTGRFRGIGGQKRRNGEGVAEPSDADVDVGIGDQVAVPQGCLAESGHDQVGVGWSMTSRTV